MKKRVHLVYLYPAEMNTYGDWGNVLCLIQRMKWRGLQIDVTEYHPGDVWPKNIDMLFMGGGQDSGQNLILKDFHKQGDNLVSAIEAGVPTLAICGAYQLLGHYFLTSSGQRLEGLGVFDLYTRAEAGRLIGNTIVDSPAFGTLIGFENHSGRTVLHDGAVALGHVTQGEGNNGHDKTEGIMYKNAIGTYLHGSFLPKNPRVADKLIADAVGVTVQDLPILKDSYITLARKASKARPR